VNLLERGQISGYQFFALLVLSRLVPVILICPTVTLVNNPATAWPNDIIGSLLAVSLVWLIVHLGLKYPDQTIIGYTKKLLGPIGGMLVGSLILWFYFMIAFSVLRTLGETVATGLLEETPILVFLVSAAFLIANSARGGMEHNSRIAGMMIPLIIFFLLLVVVSTYNLMDPSYLRPFFFAEGLGELIWPSASVLSFYTEYLVIGMLIPYLNNPRSAMPLSMGAILTIIVILITHCIAMAAVFGPLFNSTTFPAFALARMVSLGDFFERIESLITIVWIFGAGIKCCLFFWATMVGLAQLLDLKDFRPLAYPLGALMVAIGVLSYESLIDLMDILTEAMIVFSISFIILILSALYIGSVSKKNLRDGIPNADQG
jgi:spore germination protein KB